MNIGNSVRLISRLPSHFIRVFKVIKPLGYGRNRIVGFERFTRGIEPFAILNFDIKEVVGVLLNKHEVITVTSEMIHPPIAAVLIIG